MISQTITPNWGTVGDTFIYEIKSTVNALDTSQILVFQPQLNPWIIKEVTSNFTTINATQIALTKTYYITIFEVGKQVIPTQTIGSVMLSPINVTIQSVITSQNQSTSIKEIHPPMAYPFPWISFFGIILCLGIVGAVLGFLGFRLKKYWKAKYQKSDIPEITDTRTPAEIALAQLEELQGKKLIEKSQEKEHYLMLTEIIKQYFSKIFHEKMLELTTQEVLTILEPKIDQQLFRKIKKVFLASDEVKFAKKILTEDEHKEIFEKLKSIIEKTSTTGA